MSWLITDLSSPIGVTPPTIIASAKATTPPTLSENQFGTIIVIPVPVGTQAGDLLLAEVNWQVGSTRTLTNPAGWTTVTDQEPDPGGDNFFVTSLIVPASIPADYTWDLSGMEPYSRTGCMIAIRGANPILGDSDRNFSNSLTVPDLTNNVEGSMLVAFAKANSFPIGEDFDANVPLVEQTEHTSEGAQGYAIPTNTIIAVEENLSEGVISGRSFTISGATERTVGIIVEGV